MSKRLHALQRLQAHGWQIGLRFDPLIYQDGVKEQYQTLFGQVFRHVDAELLHSVSLGSFRLPKSYYQTLSRLYPKRSCLPRPGGNRRRDGYLPGNHTR